MRLSSAALICERSSWSTISIRKSLHNPYHLFNIDDGISFADVIDVVLDPDVGLDEDWHNRDTDADMKLDRCASLEYSGDRDLRQERDVDWSTDINQ